MVNDSKIPNWFVNCVAAQILVEDHGLKISPDIWTRTPRIQGRYWYSYNQDKLIRLDPSVRPPLYQLHVDHVLALKLIPTEEARSEYVKAVGIVIQ